jgi:alpha-tubulin suppressor-like RCC1 family protein
MAGAVKLDNMINLSTRRFARTTAVFLSGALILAACGGSNDSSDSDGSRNRNAGLTVSNVALKPAVASVAAGISHSLLLDDAGNAYAFGDNEYGQTNVPALKSGASRFTAVAGGYQHSLLLDDVGNAYAFGYNAKGQTVVPALKDDASRFTAVAGGGYHSLLLDDAGNAYAFGASADGQTDVPALRNRGTRFTAVAGGGYHSLLLDDAGNAYAFGFNAKGQTVVPALKDDASRFTAVAGGGYHSLLLDDAGNAYAFGDNGYGQTVVPALRNRGTRFTAMASGFRHSLLLDDAGNAYAFGDNAKGQTVVPALKDGASKFTAMAAGIRHSLLLDDVGNAYAFGGNGYGQTTLPPALVGVNVRTMPIAMGGTEAIALNEQGIATSFVENWNPSDAELVSIAASGRHGLGITRSGSVVGWGAADFGQTNIPDITNVVQVVAGNSYSAALRNDGRVFEWGSHTAAVGKLIEKPADLERIVSLAGGFTHILGITSKGSVVGWGDNNEGKATPPEGLKNVVAIAANATCSVAATKDGKLSWWGSCPVVLTAKKLLENVTAIALTDSNAVAIVDGSLVIWGMKEDQSDVLEQDIVINPVDSPILAISAGNDAFLASDKKGNVTSWGSNWGSTITIPESFGGPAPIIDDSICENCEQPEGFTDEQFEEQLPFLIELFTPEQKAKTIAALGGSTTKPLTPEEIQALIDAAKKEGRTEAIATAREVASVAVTPPVDPATAIAAVLPASQSPTTKVTTTISTKRAVTLLGLKKVTKVAFVVPKKASVRACSVTKTQVKTIAAGVCSVKVTYTDSKKKARSTTLTLVVG